MHSTRAGTRRCAEFHGSFGRHDVQPVRTDAVISQALVPFPGAGLLGMVTGFWLNDQDIDVATVFTATTAHRMKVIPHDEHGLVS